VQRSRNRDVFAGTPRKISAHDPAGGSERIRERLET
jgi:hypothetical protein